MKMSSFLQRNKTQNNNMKYMIKVLALALFASVASVYAGEPTLPAVPEAAPSALKVNAFAASLLNEDADATYGGGVSLETISVHNVSLRASAVALEDDTFSLGGSVLYTVPVSQALSAYALGGVDYEFDQDFWSASVGAGATVNLTQRVNLFVETSYSFSLDSNKADKEWGIAAGVGVKF